MFVAIMLALTVNSKAEYVEPIGLGSESCQVWVQHHAQGDAAAKTEDEWLSGYLTAFNTFGRPPLRQSSFFRFDLANVAGAVTSACRADTQQDVFSAVTRFIKATQRLRPARSAKR
jgi:hypothetical protein